MFDSNLTSVANGLRNLVVYEAPKVAFGGTKLQEESIPEVKNDNSNVYFRDAFTNEVIGVELTSENLIRLQSVFGNGALENIGNGKTILSGKAEEFVSGWYADIAHKRGYLRADANSDGILSAEEKQNITEFFGIAAYVSGNSVIPAEFLRYAKTGEFVDGAERIARSSDSIAQELNKTLENDKDMDGRILWGDTVILADTMRYLKAILQGGDEGYVPPDLGIESYLEEWAKQLKEMLKEELKKAGIDSNTIDLNASAEEVFKQIMEKDNGAEVLQNIKEKLENQGKNSEDSTFKEIAKLTKLDEETLAYNLNNNPNFEEDIISIVQELTQNVDSQFALNDDSNALQKAFSITA